MEQIRLDNQLPVKKTDHTSKGDQLKWKIGNIWYKSDYMGYEGLSETLVSHLLQKSTLPPVCPVSASSDCIPRYSPQWLFQS